MVMCGERPAPRAAPCPCRLIAAVADAASLPLTPDRHRIPAAPPPTPPCLTSTDAVSPQANDTTSPEEDGDEEFEFVDDDDMALMDI
uniref:Uncharacterized protein n=1 Tax=Leersia perrieri TaxID=77586 RepID=A0A0D9WRR8_9ORYZ